MGYIKQTFKDNETILKSEHLNHIEDGLTSILGQDILFTKDDFVNGSYVGTDLSVSEKNRIRTSLIKATNGDICEFELEDGWLGYIAFQKVSGGNFTVATGWETKVSYEFAQDCEFIVVLKKSDESNITRNNYNSIAKLYSQPTIKLNGANVENSSVKKYFLDEIETTKSSVKELLTEPCLTFVMLSDIHYMVSGEKPKSIDDCVNNILELSKDLQFDFIACLGDITEGDKEQSVIQEWNDHILGQFKKTGIPYYQCIGNHDDNRYKEKFTHEQLYRNFIRNTKNVVFDNKTSMCGTNFYKDYDELNIRCIFLNANNNGSYGYSNDTCNWFAEVVKNTDKRFIVFTHISPIPNQNYGGKYGIDDGSLKIKNICIDHKDRLIILFSGHNHYDASFVDPFLSFTINCQKFENENGDPSLWATGAVKPTRTVGDYTEDCFDVVIVRPISKKINRVRFGAGEDQEYLYE